MLALETLARRVHDDRPQAKYARQPPYGDDVKWLLQISKKLGKVIRKTQQREGNAKVLYICSNEVKYFHFRYTISSQILRLRSQFHS